MPNKHEAGGSNYGQVTKGAAYALRGKIYIWLKEYEKAIADTSTANGLTARVRNERKVEFFNEGQNLFDELRRGTLKQSKFETPDPGCVQVWSGNLCILNALPVAK